MKLLPWIALALGLVASVVVYLVWRDRLQVATVGVGDNPSFTFHPM